MQGRSHCSRFSREEQCPLHCSVPRRLGKAEASWESGSSWRNRLVNTDTELPQRCSKTRRFASGRTPLACRPSSRSPGSRTKSSQLCHTCPQQPQARNGSSRGRSSPGSIINHIISPRGGGGHRKVQGASAQHGVRRCVARSAGWRRSSLQRCPRASASGGPGRLACPESVTPPDSPARRATVWCLTQRTLLDSFYSGNRPCTSASHPRGEGGERGVFVRLGRVGVHEDLAAMRLED